MGYIDYDMVMYIIDEFIKESHDKIYKILEKYPAKDMDIVEDKYRAIIGILENKPADNKMSEDQRILDATIGCNCAAHIINNRLKELKVVEIK